MGSRMRPLMHLALAVLDEEASRRFYEQHFGFQVARRAEDGTLMMRSTDGFSLALGHWDGDARLPAFLHHGFRAESPDDVHAYAARFRAEGLEIVEESDEPDYVSVKTRDPSGYVVEVAWEQGRWMGRPAT
jgi:catechol 2,3-dioxygenase-like lactoylglutathione lyase family enzyme